MANAITSETNASISDAVPWLKVQLGHGALPDGRRLWSAAQADEMWKPQTIVSSGPLFPEDGIGFVVYSNTGDGEPISGLRYALADHLLSAPGFDWVAATRKDIAKVQAEVLAAVGSEDFKAPAGGPSLPLERYAGRYRDPWYGDILVARDGERLRVEFTHTPTFKSALEPFRPDSFRTRFPRGTGEDAVLHFALKEGRVTGITLKPLSPLADFSFDFQDLALAPVKP